MLARPLRHPGQDQRVIDPNTHVGALAGDCRSVRRWPCGGTSGRCGGTRESSSFDRCDGPAVRRALVVLYPTLILRPRTEAQKLLGRSCLANGWPRSGHAVLMVLSASQRPEQDQRVCIREHPRVLRQMKVANTTTCIGRLLRCRTRLASQPLRRERRRVKMKLT